MLTLQGIPLFYPVFKNPCVLPANPELRIRTGNLKLEGIALFIFSLMTIFMQDLFANGFWTTLNKSFGSITHVNKEFKNTNNLMEVTYNYIEFGETKKGKGIVLESSKNEVKLFSDNKILTISKNNSNQKKIDLEFELRKEKYKYITRKFIGITEKEINQICLNRVVKGTVTSTETFILNNTSKVENNLIFENTYSPIFKFMNKDTLKIKLNRELKQKQIQLNKIDKINSENINILKNYKKDKRIIEGLINSSIDIYTRNKYEKELIKITDKIDNYKFKKLEKESIRQEIIFIKRLIKEDKRGTFSGSIQYLEIPNKTEDYRNSMEITATD
jgi:inner membrane protein